MHGRLREARIKLKKEQVDFYTVLELSQTAYSNREAGKTPITIKELEILEKEFRISKVWILTGDGYMLLSKPGEVNEPMETVFDFSENGLRSRFQEAIRDYMEKHSIKEQRDVAAKANMNETQLSKVMNDSKFVSMNMLINAHRFLNFNLNYMSGGIGGYYLGEGSASDKKRIAELEELLNLYRDKVNAEPVKKRA